MQKNSTLGLLNKKRRTRVADSVLNISYDYSYTGFLHKKLNIDFLSNQTQNGVKATFSSFHTYIPFHSYLAKLGHKNG